MKKINTIKKLTAALMALAITSSLAACAPSTARGQEQEHEVKLTALSNFISEAEAREKATSYLNTGNAQIVSGETELDNGKYEFEIVDGDMEYTVEVDAKTGTVTEVESEPIQKAAPEVPPQTEPDIIPVDQAKALVLDYLGVASATFVNHETELDDGKYEFEVITGDYEYDIEVNARTGAIGEVDKEPVKKQPPATEPAPTEPKATEPAQPKFLTVSEAEAIALTYVNDASATVNRRETDLDDGKYEFEIRTQDYEYDIEVNARTGVIGEVDKEPVEKAASITMTEAKQIVRDHLKDADAVFTDAELDDGVYEFEVRSGKAEYEYEVDAVTGKILKAERDD